ncbi:hypothetical protein GWI34_05525 [Actinomadura sp. DSM 109109]|nr:hypothetical protein [Actinomadura lepetitiana]
MSGLVTEDATDEGEPIRVRARSRKLPVPCPECVAETTHVDGWCKRTVTHVPVDGRPVVLDVRLRRLACRDLRCPGGRSGSNSSGCWNGISEELSG